MEEWKEYKLSDIADVRTGPFGSQLHNEDYVVSGTPIVTVEHLGNRRFSLQNLPMVSDLDRTRLSKYLLLKGDIVFSRVGSVDRCSYVDTEESGWLFSGRCIRVRSNDCIFPLFLYYYFCKPSIKQYIRNIAVGATMPSINTKLMADVPVKLPSKNIQQQITNILSSLDDKIELNRRINDNLEQQAQALFKSWFVDFEPFKDSNFVDSELGVIPEGWRVVTLSSFITPLTEKVLAGSLPEYSVTNNGIIPRSEKYTKQLSSTTSKNKVLRKFNLVFGMSREILNWGIMLDKIGGVSSAYNIYSIDDNVVNPLYLKYYIESNISYFNDLIGTAAREGQALDKGGLNNKLILVPPFDIWCKFQVKDTTLKKTISTKETEIVILANLRDSILPKLMSGELKINDLNC